jgi:hypothetical protein
MRQTMQRRCVRAAILVALFAASSSHASVLDLDWSAAHDLATPPPRFITHHYIALADVESLSKFRSGYGHVFSDEYEAPDRSMKHYVAPLPAFRRGDNASLRVFAPVTGRVVSVIRSEGSGPGSPENYQIHVVPDGFPAFEVRLFHVNPATGIVVGARVVGGQPIGFADMREAENSDIAVEGIVLGAPTHPSPMRPPGTFPDRGIRMFSQFDVMTDALFADYHARGVRVARRVRHPARVPRRESRHLVHVPRRRVGRARRCRRAADRRVPPCSVRPLLHHRGGRGDRGSGSGRA